MIVDILVDINSSKLDRLFSYNVPEELEELIAVSKRVIINFNNKDITGFIIKIKEGINNDYKYIKDVIDYSTLLNKELFKLLIYLKETSYSTLLQIIKTMIPSVFDVKLRKYFKIINDDIPINVKELFNNNILLFSKEIKKYLPLINEQIKNNNIIEVCETKYLTKAKKIKYYKFISELGVKSISQLQIINLLKEKDLSIDDIKNNNLSQSSLKTLIKKNNVLEYEEVINRKKDSLNLKLTRHTLNDEQLIAYNNVVFDEYKPYLLYGVTGSGKTEVFLHLIEKCIKNNKNVLILVPEISLTPQLYTYLENMYSDYVGLYHSSLSNGQRFDYYNRVKNGDIRIVVGTRSACFLPLCNIGLIIVDEAHEKSYIQTSDFLYDAKEILKIRAKYYNAPLIFASATPSISDYYYAQSGTYKLLTLNKRATNLDLPKTYIVSMKEEFKKGNDILSDTLKEKIDSTLASNNQVIIFINKRGYSQNYVCKNCGYIPKCSNCDLPFTYHKSINKLKCHYCNKIEDAYMTCPVCRSNHIDHIGIGTEAVMNYLKNIYKNKVIVQMDKDTTYKKNSFELIYKKMVNKEIDILVGTKMVTKGLDFKDVTLVGVIRADISFFQNTYDSLEEGYQLLEQVEGRAGRHLKGEVVIQTFNPDNNAIVKACEHDFINFYYEEIKKRKLYNYPPFVLIKKINISSNDKYKALVFARKTVNSLKKNIKGLVIGPCESLIFKINNRYYYDIYIKYQSEVDIKILKEIYNDYLKNQDDIFMKVGNI